MLLTGRDADDANIDRFLTKATFNNKSFQPIKVKLKLSVYQLSN